MDKEKKNKNRRIKREKFSKRVFSFFAVFMLLFSLTSCEFLQETAREYYPTVSLRSVDLADFDLNGVDLNFKYNIHNKAAFPINMNRLAFKIYVDGKQLTDMENSKKISIPANGDSALEFVHRFKFVETFQSLSALFKQDKVKVKLDGVTGFVLSQTLGSIDVPIKAEKEITIPKIPKVKVSSFKYVKTSFNPLNPKATFNLKLDVANPNTFALDVSRLNYKFNVKGKELFTGITKNINVSGKKSKEINLPITLQGVEIIKLLPELKNFSSLDYKFLSDVYMKFAGQEMKIPLSYP